MVPTQLLEDSIWPLDRIDDFMGVGSVGDTNTPPSNVVDAVEAFVYPLMK